MPTLSQAFPRWLLLRRNRFNEPRLSCPRANESPIVSMALCPEERANDLNRFVFSFHVWLSSSISSLFALSHSLRINCWSPPVSSHTLSFAFLFLTILLFFMFRRYKKHERKMPGTWIISQKENQYPKSTPSRAARREHRYEFHISPQREALILSLVAASSSPSPSLTQFDIDNNDWSNAEFSISYFVMYCFHIFLSWYHFFSFSRCAFFLCYSPVCQMKRTKQTHTKGKRCKNIRVIDIVFHEMEKKILQTRNHTVALYV